MNLPNISLIIYLIDNNGEIKTKAVQFLLLAKWVATEVPKDLPKTIILFLLILRLSTK